jgi:hypothetical protein
MFDENSSRFVYLGLESARGAPLVRCGGHKPPDGVFKGN